MYIYMFLWRERFGLCACTCVSSVKTNLYMCVCSLSESTQTRLLYEKLFLQGNLAEHLICIPTYGGISCLMSLDSCSSAIVQLLHKGGGNRQILTLSVTASASAAEVQCQ